MEEKNITNQTNEVKQTKPVSQAKTGTNQWKTAVFTIEDIALDNTYLKNSCFRINNDVATATPLYIAEIRAALGYSGE